MREPRKVPTNKFRVFKAIDNVSSQLKLVEKQEAQTSPYVHTLYLIFASENVRSYLLQKQSVTTFAQIYI